MYFDCKIYCFLIVAAMLLGFAAGQNSAFLQSNVISTISDNLKNRCQQNAGSGWEAVFNKTVEGQTTFKQCVENYINIDDLKNKMAEARREGRLDEVFGNYCQRKNIPQTCLKDYTTTLEPCLQDSEKSSINILHNITEKLANFVCHNDGDRIALFIAEKGPECLRNKTEAIQQCGNNLRPGSFNLTDNINIDLSNAIVDQTKLCNEFDQLKNCVVNALEQCAESTPSNMVDSLFKFIRRSLPC